MYNRYPAGYSLCFLMGFFQEEEEEEEDEADQNKRHSPLLLSPVAAISVPFLTCVFPFTGNSAPFLTLAFAHHWDLCAFRHSSLCPSQGGGKGSEAAQGQDSGGGSQH